MFHNLPIGKIKVKYNLTSLVPSNRRVATAISSRLKPLTFVKYNFLRPSKNDWNVDFTSGFNAIPVTNGCVKEF